MPSTVSSFPYETTGNEASSQAANETLSIVPGSAVNETTSLAYLSTYPSAMELTYYGVESAPTLYLDSSIPAR